MDGTFRLCNVVAKSKRAFILGQSFALGSIEGFREIYLEQSPDSKDGK